MMIILVKYFGVSKQKNITVVWFRGNEIIYNNQKSEFATQYWLVQKECHCSGWTWTWKTQCRLFCGHSMHSLGICPSHRNGMPTALAPYILGPLLVRFSLHRYWTGWKITKDQGWHSTHSAPVAFSWITSTLWCPWHPSQISHFHQDKKASIM